MKTIILGHNADGELRYIETITANGARATGITADLSKATKFETWDQANEMLANLIRWDTWLYRWRIAEAVVKPCGRSFSDLDANEKRFPLLIRAMRWAAILSTGEARAAIRDFKNRHEYPGAELGGEATAHFGGTTAVIRAAIRARSAVRAFHTAIAE